MAESPDPRTMLKAREQYAQERLRTLSIGLGSLESLKDVDNVCIYVTGSFGRLEASEHSDLDLFFVQPSDPGPALGRIDKTLLDADVIRTARQLRFPEFSRDGLFRDVHQVAEILSNLGG